MRKPGFIAFAVLFLAAGSVIAAQAQRERRLEDRVRALERETRKVSQVAAPLRSVVPIGSPGVAAASLPAMAARPLLPPEPAPIRAPADPPLQWGWSNWEDLLEWRYDLLLTSEQKARIGSLVRQRREELQALSGENLPEDDNRRAFRKEIQDRYEHAIAAVLDSDQLRLYAEWKRVHRECRLGLLEETLVERTGEIGLPRPTD